MEAVFSASNASKMEKYVSMSLLVSSTVRNWIRMSKKLFKRLKQRPVRVRKKKLCTKIYQKGDQKVIWLQNF